MGIFRKRRGSFFADRYGADNFYRFLLFLVFGLLIASIFIKTEWLSALLYCFAVILSIYSLYRVFSRRLDKRRKENLRYLAIRNKVIAPFTLAKNKFRDRKTHKYIKCKSCKANIRVKRVSGEHTLRCPRCSSKINVKIK